MKNLTDGRVELQVFGDPDEVRAFLTEIREGELNSHIRTVQELEIPPSLDVKGFEIRF